MEIVIARESVHDGGTFGTLTLNVGGLALSTLEPAPAVLPAGSYAAERYESPHLGRTVVRLLDVPGHDGIEIHNGNYESQTHGCVLVGLSAGVDYLNFSDAALNTLITALDDSPITVTVHDAP